jgi:hypothetical protein
MAGPTCGAERVGHPCPPQPVHGTVSAHDVSGRVVAFTRTAPDGGYSIALDPGRYTLTVATSSQWPWCPPTDAVVLPNVVSAVNITCDTGIR